ncbi:prolyl oligopeptidase family serine peptidase [Rubrivivax benzoatilyticus]|uniref:S9 family peptidase n=1 Tax=Rubrivivax benzoatilyticus TaxID=316997 RepID=A0ABX0HZ89_9BURK|nr:prolyl oligopeptidase family serine peptidase [Rubrivivax benzoatilyticus]EGJ08979.1 prolyl oligopeptidase family protein [Rubrivivax benzoatilyticus JA2 = ATCC BAA-35]NHL00326.1 S9 family peptidase [Rubrivivax benzoatilyticus]NHL26198.1 S9 family peptidase [Rubrivivax benzoatilyticus]
MISRRDFSFALPLAAAVPTMTLAAPLPDDELLWLEDVQGERALAWVRERNAETEALLQKQPGFDATRQRIRAILDSRDRIPGVVRRGPWLYNLWQDEHNPRGLWRRTTLAEYRKREPAWETVLDVDALGRAEGENWTWSGAVALGPEYRRVLVKLSRGGADAHVVREFDTVAKRFVDGGFVLPEAKSEVDWIGPDEIAVGTDFGPGSLTDSGYPRVVKRWRRGTPLAAATTMFEGRKTDVAAGVSIDHTPGYERTVFQRAVDFYRSEMFLLQGERLLRLDKPDDAELSFWKSRVLLTLRSDWTVAGRSWKSGSLLVADADAYLRGERRFEALFEPTATRSLAGMTATRDTLIVEILDNVAGRLEEWRPVDGRWQRREVAAPFPGTLSAVALHDPELADDPLADAYLLQYTDFLTPDTLALGHVGRDEREVLKSRPSFYDAAGMRVEQRFATSRDGTRVPYFVVWPRGAKADGANPTLLYGYGGFEVSMQPYYSGVVGSSWLARGGVFVLANIRGGGEFGPAWHQAAVGANRQKAYDDFAAVAEDLIATRVTSPRHLGIEGGSNGGLLVGAVMVQRPELFNAVVCQVPLLDMKRYTKLLAGASWMAEYGDPDDPAQWSFISRYSPFQNVRAGVKMPRVLFVTSTRDDRVHPGHARRMAERMRRQGHDVLYWENIEGGHGGAADNGQRAQMTALEYAFLQLQLGR